MGWNYTKTKNSVVLKNPIFISGLPGIGNVGKIVADFLVDELKAKKIITFNTYSMPNSVIVNEKNLIELPSIDIYAKKIKNNDLIILTGNYQPIDEISSFEFCEMILDILKEIKSEQIITLGGIGLREIPKDPKIYITGNIKKEIMEYKKGTKLNNKVYGVVGPIMGVTGILTAMAKKRKISAISILGETLGHPLYFGLKPARKILSVLNKKHNLKIKLTKIDKEIKEIDSMMKKDKNFEALKEKPALKKFAKYTDMSYIG
jgi:uncharacterized protein